MLRLTLLSVFIGILSVMQGQVSFNIDSIGLWNDDTLPPNATNNYNEVWGFEHKGKEYGVIGSRAGTYIVDVTTPSSPDLIKYIPGKFSGAINRDYHSHKGYLYMVCDQGASSLQIVDLNFLPDSVSLIYDSDDLFSNCHNIFIDSVSEKLFACDVRDNTNFDIDLEVLDLKNGPIPVSLNKYTHPTINSFHDIYVKDDTAIGNNGNSGLYVYSVANNGNLKIVGSMPNYPEKGYNHSGYPSTDGDYYYMADETTGKDLKVVDIRDYSEMKVVDLFNAGQNKTEIIAHNQLVKDTLLFVSYYHEGFQLYNIADPKEAKKVGHYQTYTKTYIDSLGVRRKDYNGAPGAWGVYPYLPSGHILVSDRTKGLFIFELGDLTAPMPEPPLPPLSPELYKLVFPNPVETQIQLVYPFNKITHIELFNVEGKRIMRDVAFSDGGRTTIIELNRKLDAGMYILEIRGETENFSVKIAVE